MIHRDIILYSVQAVSNRWDESILSLPIGIIIFFRFAHLMCITHKVLEHSDECYRQTTSNTVLYRTIIIPQFFF